MKDILNKIWNHEKKLKHLRNKRKGLRGLRQGVNTRELEEQYLCYLNVEGQRGELSSLMMPEGQLVLRQSLRKNEYKSLLGLLRIIRRNKQQARQVLFSALGFTIALMVAIFVLLKSPLSAHFMENRLEKVLGTSVNIHSPTLHWNGTLEYAGISINIPQMFADKSTLEEQTPAYLKDIKDSSTIELGPGTLKFSLWALLQNKLVLNDFLSQTIQLSTWKDYNPSEKPKTNIVRLEIEGMIEDAKNNFASFQSARGLTQRFSKGQNWAQEIRTNQQLINRSYNTLGRIGNSLVSLENGNTLLEQSYTASRNLTNLLRNTRRQIINLNGQLTNSNNLINTVNATFDEDFLTLQKQVLSGDILQAPVSVLVDAYLAVYLRNFREISLWLAATLRNLQQYQRTKSYAGQRKEFSSLFKQNTDGNNQYQFPGLFYPYFALNYFEAGLGATGNLKISTLSSDGDVLRSPTVAIFTSPQSQFSLFYENRQLPISRLRQPSDCNLLGFNTCHTPAGITEKNIGKSQFRFQLNKPEFAMSDIFFASSGLEFIRNYSANLALEIIGKEIDPHAKHANLKIELKANLSNTTLETTGELNALQQALAAILLDYPLQLTAQFILNEESPQELRDMQISSNIVEILTSTLELEGQETGFQRAILLLKNRLNEDLSRMIQPLQSEITKLDNYRAEFQQQIYSLNRQRNQTNRIIGDIQYKIEQQKKSRQQLFNNNSLNTNPNNNRNSNNSGF